MWYFSGHQSSYKRCSNCVPPIFINLCGNISSKCCLRAIKKCAGISMCCIFWNLVKRNVLQKITFCVLQFYCSFFLDIFRIKSFPKAIERCSGILLWWNYVFFFWFKGIPSKRSTVFSRKFRKAASINWFNKTSCPKNILTITSKCLMKILYKKMCKTVSICNLNIYSNVR